MSYQISISKTLWQCVVEYWLFEYLLKKKFLGILNDIVKFYLKLSFFFCKFFTKIYDFLNTSLKIESFLDFWFGDVYIFPFRFLFNSINENDLVFYILWKISIKLKIEKFLNLGLRKEYFYVFLFSQNEANFHFRT